MKTKYIIIALVITLSLLSIQLVNANVSTMITTFQKPNVDLIIKNNTVLIPDNIGQLSKHYDHEDFKKLIDDQISKAEKIRDKIMNTQTRDY